MNEPNNNWVSVRVTIITPRVSDTRLKHYSEEKSLYITRCAQLMLVWAEWYGSACFYLFWRHNCYILIDIQLIETDFHSNKRT